MRIRSFGMLVTIAFLVFLLAWGFLLFGIFSGLFEIALDVGSFIIMLVSLLFTYLVYYFFMLFKAQNYVLVLNEDDFLYSFFISKQYKYREIDEMHLIRLRYRLGGELRILKLRFKNGSSIIFSVDRLKKPLRDNIIDTFERKARRNFLHRDWKYIF